MDHPAKSAAYTTIGQTPPDDFSIGIKPNCLTFHGIGLSLFLLCL